MDIRNNERTKIVKRSKTYSNVLNYTVLLPIALADQKDSLESLKRIYHYLQTSQESEFNQFCFHFPYMDFFQYSISHINSELGQIAFGCFSCALYSSVKKPNFSTPENIQFFISLFQSNNSSLISSSLSVLYNICAINEGSRKRNPIYYLIDNGIISILKTLPQSVQMIQFIELLSTIQSPFIPDLCLLIINYLNSDDVEFLYHAMIAVYNIFKTCVTNVKEIKEIFWPIFTNNIIRYFYVKKNRFYIKFFRALNCFDGLPYEYGSTILEIIFASKPKRNTKRDKLVGVAMSLFLFNNENWAPFLSEKFVFTFFAPNEKKSIYEKSSFKVQNFIIEGLVHYFKFEDGKDVCYGIVGVLIDALERDGLELLCLSKLISILVMNEKNTILLNLFTEKIQIFNDLCLSENDKIQEMALKIIEWIEQS